MNALLGAAYLPMGALPMTSVVTTVRYGSRPRAMIRHRGSGIPAEVPLAGISRYIAQASTERSELQVSSVELEVPAEILRLSFEFADTPGVGSAIELNTAVTARFLPQADAVIFVTGFDSPLTEAEAGFLADELRHGGKLFLVINKLDLVSARDATEVTEFVRRWLGEHSAGRRSQLFTLSALDGLEASVQDDGERLARSGILSFRAALTEFLTTEKSRTSLRNVTAQAAGLILGQQRDLRLGGRQPGPADRVSRL